jgi:hypothetical protein
MKMRAKMKICIAIVIVFLSGAVIGFFGGQVYVQWRVEAMRQRGPEALQQFLRGRFKKRLHLREDQMPTIEEVIRKTVQDMDKLRRQHGATVWARMEETLSEIRPVLTPEQQQVLDQMSMADLLPSREHRPPR